MTLRQLANRSVPPTSRWPSTPSRLALRRWRALARLHRELQGLELDTRRTTIQAMTPELRGALTHFMLAADAARRGPRRGASEAAAATTAASLHPAFALGPGSPRQRCSPATSGPMPNSSKGLMTNRLTGQHKAYLDIMGLRMYTQWTTDRAAALHHAAALSHLREVLRGALVGDPLLWWRPAAALHLCEDALRSRGTSPHALGLRALVALRACRWLGSHQIISPSLPLEEALRTQARLLHARDMSWEALRAEWVQLLAEKWSRRGAAANADSPSWEVVALVEGVRRRAAEGRLASALAAAKRLFPPSLPPRGRATVAAAAASRQVAASSDPLLRSGRTLPARGRATEEEEEEEAGPTAAAAGRKRRR